MPRDLALDLGTANTLLAADPDGVLRREPTVCAVDDRNDDVVAIGSAALQLATQRPVVLVKPLRHGSIGDFDVTEGFVRLLLGDLRGKWFSQPRLLVAQSAVTTVVERRAVSEAILAAGVRTVLLMEESAAAAIGAGLPIDQPAGTCVVDVGGGTTEIAVISLGGIVAQKATPVGGIDFDEAIIRLLAEEHSLAVAETAANRIVHDVASAVPMPDEPDLEIRGRDLTTGEPREVVVTSKQVRVALEEPIAKIMEVIRETFAITPPELAQDVLDRGLTLTGGGSLLKGLDQRIANETHLPVHRAEDPLETVIKGLQLSLGSIDRLKELGVVSVA
jgi:rod shape-determining protein MreB and related proteins